MTHNDVPRFIQWEPFWKAEDERKAQEALAARRKRIRIVAKFLGWLLVIAIAACAVKCVAEGGF